jgi:fatty-acyl-CoA synthase
MPTTPIFPSADTVSEALVAAARNSPKNALFVYDRRGQNVDRRTYPAFLELAKGGAARLAGADVQPGERVLICLPTSWDLLEIYFGAILRGAIPVLVAPPGALGGAAAHAKKIEGLVELLTPRRFICDESSRRELNDFGAPKAAAASMLVSELAAVAPASGNFLYRAKPDELAFMQLTSGSTGRQRAVMIRHANVIHNAAAIFHLSSPQPHKRHEAVVSWLPLNHDMGLVGCLMFALAYGIDIHLLRPDTFLARPKLWLQLFNDHKATMSPGPNFAYQLCIDRIDDDDVAGLDISTWRSALTGAEMIHPDTCANFCEKFAPQKFNPHSLVPSYGMAETTLAATSDMQLKGVRTAPIPHGQEHRDEPNEVVCVGSPVIDTEVRISSPSAPGEFISDEQIGEIWVKGPSVFSGYYNDAAATAESLHDGWLSTGDLGFLKKGELHITGRIKDLLIVNGQNLMPHELEWLAEEATGGGGTERSGAFSIEKDGTGEHAVVVAEVASAGDAEKIAAIQQDIRSRIGRTLGLPLADVVLVKRGVIPKTTSGKVQRRELRQRYIDGKLERL